MEERKSWRWELADNGWCYCIAAGMVCVFYGLARMAHLLGAPLLAGILIITSLQFIEHLA